MDWMEAVAPMVALLGVIGTVFNYSIIKPLNETIESLNAAVKRINDGLIEMDKKRQELEIRLTRMEVNIENMQASMEEHEKRLVHLYERTNDPSN